MVPRILNRPISIAAVFISFNSISYCQTLTGKWRLLEFKDCLTGEIMDTSTIQNGSIASYKHVKLNFQDSSSAGEIQGNSFCNNVKGKYKLSGKNKIRISSFGGTKDALSL